MRNSREGSGMGVLFFAVALLCHRIAPVAAQVSPPGTYGGYPYATFTPSMAIIIVVLVAALFFMGFFAIYIRNCSDAAAAVSGGGGTAFSIRARRGAAAARGLDPAVIETLPTFSYAEVKDHKIGKGALECAVCLNEFGEDETLRLIPRCDHVFHPECIDVWLESHVTCPVCRANLAPPPGEEQVQEARPATTDGDRSESSSSRADESPGRLDVAANRNPSFDQPSDPPRSWSIRPTRVFGFGRFRSHSTGHSLVQPGQNLDRFTLRLPAEIRREVMGRAALKRASTLPREGSSRKGYRPSSGEGSGSGRTGRFYRRVEQFDRGTKSDRWDFLTRGFSVRSTRVVAEGGSGSSRGPVRMPSLGCLEPKGADRNELFSDGPSHSPV